MVAEGRVVLSRFSRQPLQLRQAPQRFVDPIEVRPSRVHALVLPPGERGDLLGVARDYRDPLDQLQCLVKARARLYARLIDKIVHDFVREGGGFKRWVWIPE